MKKNRVGRNTANKPQRLLAQPVVKLPKESAAALLRLLAQACLQAHRLPAHREYGRALLLTAGQAGDRAACRLLSDYYRDGSHGFPHDKERHLHWWLRSERRLWSEQTPLYRYRQWKLSWSAGAGKRVIL